MAQLDTGSIRGSVKDPTGAAIPNAEVKVVNEGTQRVWLLKTNGTGEYTVPTLPVGTYSVTASAPNFGAVRLSGIALNASESYRADLLLQPGTVSQQVTVVADQMQVNTLGSDLGTTIDGDRVANLPLNGRDFADLLALVPGSVTSGQFGQTSLGGVETSYAGVNVLLDGTDATRIDTNATSMQLGREGARITRASVDSIAEFHVLQGNFSAEYGRSIGDVVNVITKSGTNTLHGEVFEFLRNDALDAKNYFATAGSETPLRLNQFGGNLSGPIQREKLLFFTNYEGVRQTITNTKVYDVLNAAHRANFVAAMAPVVAAIPEGNLGADPNNSNFDLYSANMINTLREDTGSIRVDWNPSEKNKFYARYNVGDSYTTTTYGPAVGQTAPTPARSQFLKLSSTHIFSPSLLNEAGFGLNSNHVESYGGGGNFPVLAVSCFYCDFGVGPGPATFASIRPQTSYQYIDTLTKLWGRHSLKVGADIRHNVSDEMLGLQEFLYYGSISDFENNNGFAFGTLGNPWTRIRGTNWDFFAQDDIRLLSRLTLNLGVRYEYNSVLHEKDGQLANFDIATQTVGTPGAQLYEPDRNNFAPRVGFSWDPLGHGVTVLRGGIGAFYNPQLTGAVFSLTDNTSENISVNVFQELFGTVSCTPGFPLSYPVDTVPTCTPQVRNVDQYDSKARDSYAWHWSFGLQQQMMKNTVLDISYSGHRGLKLPAGAAFAGLQFNNQNVYTGEYPLSTDYANERLLGNYLDSKYNSMQTSLRGHHTKLTYDVNYTWSHSFDDTVDIFSAFNNPTNPQNDFSVGATDVRNNMTADLYYRTPDIAFLPQLLGRGWEIGAIASARSGLPVNIATNVSAANGGLQRPELKDGVSLSQLQTGNKHGVQFNADIFKDPTGAQATSTDTIQGYDTLGNIPRNAGRGPGFAQVDLSFKKVTQIADKWRVDFRADLFNIANHANFANPDGNLTDAAFGVSTSTINSLVGTGTSRQVQFSLRIVR
jgi:outer membrane receptor protein involved in Fe transport